MTKLVIANWKMNPKSLDEARKLVSAWEHDIRTEKVSTQVVVCAPFVFLPFLSKHAKQLFLGAQNASWAQEGALTGEVSAVQLKDLGIKYVIVGHSERRLFLGETDSTANAKVLAVLKAGLIPVLCLGGERGAVMAEMKTLVTKQFIHATKDLTKQQLKKIVYAYEPVWAISTMKNSKAADGQHAADMISHIQELLARKLGNKTAATVKIIYGGTVNHKNVHEYAKYPQISGALVGGASLHADNFWEIVKEFDRESIHRS